jgi:hypothetical protein
MIETLKVVTCDRCLKSMKVHENQCVQKQAAQVAGYTTLSFRLPGTTGQVKRDALEGGKHLCDPCTGALIAWLELGLGKSK